MFNSFIRSIRLLSLLTLITGAACVPVVEAPSPAPEPESADPTAALWTVTEGIETPESVYVDPVSGSTSFPRSPETRVPLTGTDGSSS